MHTPLIVHVCCRACFYFYFVFYFIFFYFRRGYSLFDAFSRPRVSLMMPGPFVRGLTALFYVLAWAGASSGLIFLNKHLLTDDGFHYPMTLCSMG